MGMGNNDQEDGTKPAYFRLHIPQCLQDQPYLTPLKPPSDQRGACTPQSSSSLSPTSQQAHHRLHQDRGQSGHLPWGREGQSRQLCRVSASECVHATPDFNEEEL